VAAAPSLSDFLACVIMHGFLNGPGPFTVFAPDNAAFAKLGPPGTLDTPGTLETILGNEALLTRMLAARGRAGKIK